MRFPSCRWWLPDHQRLAITLEKNVIALKSYRPWQDDCHPSCRCSRCDQRIVNENKSHLRPLQLELCWELQRCNPWRWSDRTVAELLNIRPTTLRAWIGESA